MTNKQTRLIQWAIGWLLVATFLAMPLTSTAAPSQPQQFGPSSYLPLLRNNYCNGTRSADNFIGTQVYGATGYGRNDFALLQNSQAAWVRNSIVWPQIEPSNVEPSQFNWAAADAALQAAVDNCVNLIVTVEDTTSWAATTGGRSPIKAEFLDDYAEFVAAAAERYDGDGDHDAPNGVVVNYWEFYNEPDFGSEVPGQEGWGNFGDRYAEMLKAIYGPIHEANPNAKVVFGGIAYNLFVGEGNGGLFVRDFFKNVLAAGGGDYFDVMNFHYYPFQHNRQVWTETNASGLREKYALIKSQMEDAGIGDKPIMLTELGWHSATTNADYPSNQEYQARRVVELLTQSVALGAMVAIWWTFDDQGLQFPYRTGLLVPGNPVTPKLSYTVYLETVKRLGAAQFDGTISEPTTENDLEAYRFLDPATGKPFYVAWLNSVVPPHKDFVPTFDDSAGQDLQVNGESASIYSKEGTLQKTISDADDGADDGKITVTVGRNPIYIVIK